MAEFLTLAPGLTYHPGYLDRDAQHEIAAAIGELIEVAPLFTPVMPRSARPFSVRMTNAGPLGWVSDVAGYRYQPHHPTTHAPWPPIPPPLLDAWTALSRYPHPPEACLVNVYGPAAKMGLHQDRDEEDFDAPVVSLSLGDTALFRFGGLRRADPTSSIRLHSGDAVVIGGPARLAFHGIDRLVPGSSALLQGGGRINLTLRRVSRPT